jgi:hypothetical protein
MERLLASLNKRITRHTECMITLASCCRADEHGPDKHLGSEILCDGKLLKGIRMWDLRNQITDVEKCAEIIQLFNSQVCILQETKNGGSSNCSLVKVLN